jgi:hypothetical protein
VFLVGWRIPLQDATVERTAGSADWPEGGTGFGLVPLGVAPGRKKRYTADSFRVLTARLKGQALPIVTETEPQQAEVDLQPMAVEPVPHADISRVKLPVFEPIRFTPPPSREVIEEPEETFSEGGAGDLDDGAAGSYGEEPLVAAPPAPDLSQDFWPAPDAPSWPELPAEDLRQAETEAVPPAEPEPLPEEETEPPLVATPADAEQVSDEDAEPPAEVAVPEQVQISEVAADQPAPAMELHGPVSAEWEAPESYQAVVSLPDEVAQRYVDATAEVVSQLDMPEPETTPESPDTFGNSEPTEAAAVPANAEEEKPLPEDQPGEARSANTISPLTDRVFDAMLKTVADAVYARPTASERAAFLRDVANDVTAGNTVTIQPAPKVEDILPAIEPPRPVEEEDIAESLAEKLGPAASILKKTDETADPFSKSLDAIDLDPKLTETPEADEDIGETALSLLDMMSAGSGTALPHERSLAADTLLRLVPRIPVKNLVTMVERLAIMESPPALLVAKLIRDPRPEVVAPLLERCMHITDQDLAMAAAEGDSIKRRMIARRRIISPTLSDQLIGFEDSSVLLTLIRNPGARFNHEAFYRLAEQAAQHPSLLAPLATRGDLPVPVAFELFWFVPQELRRFIFSRFLTDSENLNKILKITMQAHEGGEHRFPSRDLLDDAIDQVVRGNLEEATQLLSDLAGVAFDTAQRVLHDPDGEPIIVLLKALGYPRSKLAGTVELLKHSDSQLLRSDRSTADLESIFDKLSFNKARILLTYWDWFVQKAGPYASHN